MTREELSAFLRDMRKCAGKSQQEVAVSIHTNNVRISQIEQAKSNYRMNYVIAFLTAVGSGLVLRFREKDYVIDEYQQICKLLSYARKKNLYVQRKVAKLMGIDQAVYNNIESGKVCMRCDTFMKAMDSLGIAISFLPVCQQKHEVNNENTKVVTGMTREELSALMVEAREAEGCSKNEMCRRTGLTFLMLQRLESSTYGYNMQQPIKYLAALKRKMRFVCQGYSKDIKEYADILTAIKNVREQQGISQRKLAQVVNMTQPGYINAEHGKTIMRCDTFLKLIEALGITLQIVSI